VNHGRRSTDRSPSGGMVTTATAGRILALTPNGFRDVVKRGLLQPAFTFRNGPQPLSVYWREEVERLAAARQAYAEREPRLRIDLGLMPAPQGALPLGREE
jgi:hypothetical protein